MQLRQLSRNTRTQLAYHLTELLIIVLQVQIFLIQVRLFSTSSQTLTNQTLTSPVINTGISGTTVLDEDDMSSNSATQIATQQSIPHPLKQCESRTRAFYVAIGAGL